MVGRCIHLGHVADVVRPWRTAFVVGAAIAGAYTVVRIYSSYKKKQRRQKWASAGKDVVVLHQIDRAKFSPSISPFPIKLETWLRIARVPYECDFEEPMGSNGKTPWMTFNGEEVADSQSCIDLLRLKFQKDLSSHLTAEERAQARAFRLMMEEHFYWSYSTYRWGINKARDLPAIMHKVPLPPFLIQKFARHTVNQAKCQGIGRHADDRVIELGLDDLRALSAFLGTKSYLMGDVPVEEDCGVFGMLVQVVWNAPGSPFERVLNEELVNLKDYCFRMKETFWPDWGRCLNPPQY